MNDFIPQKTKSGNLFKEPTYSGLQFARNFVTTPPKDCVYSSTLLSLTWIKRTCHVLTPYTVHMLLPKLCFMDRLYRVEGQKWSDYTLDKYNVTFANIQSLHFATFKL